MRMRISLKKSTFHRSYNLQRSYERFIVNSINLKMKFPRYSLRDENGDEISGDFLGFELVKVDLERYRAVIIKSRYKNGREKNSYTNSKGMDLNLTFGYQLTNLTLNILNVYKVIML